MSLSAVSHRLLLTEIIITFQRQPGKTGTPGSVIQWQKSLCNQETNSGSIPDTSAKPVFVLIPVIRLGTDTDISTVKRDSGDGSEQYERKGGIVQWQNADSGPFFCNPGSIPGAGAMSHRSGTSSSSATSLKFLSPTKHNIPQY